MDYSAAARDEDGPQRFADPLPDFHLRNPIKPLLWLHDKTKLTSRTRIDLQYINSIGRDRVIIGSHIDLYLNESLMFPDMSLEPLEEGLADMALRCQIDIDILGIKRDLNINDIVLGSLNVATRYWNGMRFWGHILKVMNALSSKRDVPAGVTISDNVAKVKSGCHLIIVLRSGILITSDKQKYLIYDGDWVRLASDVYTQRFLYTLGCNIGRCVNSPQYPTLGKVNSVIEWGDNLLRRRGNDGFKVIKTYEALVIGVIQEKGERGIIDPGRFLRNTMQDLFDDTVSYQEDASIVVNILRSVSNIHHLTQLYGMHRIWGHPMVDSAKGMTKTIIIGRKDIIKDSSLSKDAGRMFKLLFCKEYKKRHGHFPPVIEYPSQLVTELLEGDGRAISSMHHPMSEWDRVKFKQLFQLPETFNLSMIVADKSISPTISELQTLVKTKRTIMSPDKRRGVKRWLEDTTLRPIEFLHDVNEGRFPDDHKVIGLTPKERELNPTPRMFALMSHLLRVYVVLTEQMISDHILKYFPQITMTDTLLDLTKKMYGTVKHQSIQNRFRGKDNMWASKVICMSLDFEKWNGHMRKEMTLGVFTALGDLFGLTEIYNVTYDIFEECYYYLADGTYLPSVTGGKLGLSIDEPYSFSNHKGGMEGLRQKGWTLFTVCALEVILSQHDCSYRIMGMGDNQVLQITLYTNKVQDNGAPTDHGLEEMKASMTKIFNHLVDTFTDAGLPLKPLETWMSEDLYVYGKIPIWKGVPLPMDLKKIMRMFPFSNADVMTLENALSTISGNALSSTQATSCIWTPYLVCMLMHSLCIHDFLEYHPLLGEGLLKRTANASSWSLSTSNGERYTFDMRLTRGQNRRSINMMMQIVPRTLTGYNGINILELMMRGFPDNLSRDVSYISSVLTSTKSPMWLKNCLKLWLEPIYMPQINYSTLVQDVTSVNLLSPRSPSSGIKQVVTKYLSSGTKIRNEEFKNLMLTKQKTHEEFMAELLCQGEDLHIRLIHDIMEATIYGYVDSILSKVVKTNTIQRLAMQSTTDDIFSVICHDEETFFKFFRWRCTQSGESLSSKCPTEMCREMRTVGWQRNLRGVTIPHPHSFMLETDCDHKRGCDCPDGYMSIHLPDGQIPDAMWMMSIGACPPYLGSMTREKVVVGAGGKVYSSEPLIKRPLNLLRIINWFVPPDSNTASIIKMLVSSVSDIDPEPYVGVLEGAAGAELHRYKDSSTSHGALTSSSYLLSTRYHISSDHFHRYCRGTDNTDLHFQALYCYLVEMTNLELTKCFRDGQVVPRMKHYRQCCYHCVKPVQDDFIDISNERLLTAIPSQKSNPYLFVAADKIRILENRSPLSRMEATIMDPDEYTTMSPRKKRIWLQDIVADKIICDIAGMSLTDNSVDSGLLENGSLERTMFLKLDPKYILDRVMGGLTLTAEWRWLESTGHHKVMSPGELARSMITIVSSAGSSGFMGLGMFFCWAESAGSFVNTYPEIIVPQTNPITIESVCSAIKSSMISLCLKKTWYVHERIGVIADDEKSSLWVIKKQLYMMIRDKIKCIECRRSVSRLQNTDIGRLRFVTCRSGHKPFDGHFSLPWRASFVTVERLRKDCDSFVPPSGIPEIGDVTWTGCNTLTTVILKSSDLISRPETEEYHYQDTLVKFPPSYHSFSSYHMLTVDTLPTKTRPKYIALLGPVLSLIKKQRVFVLGDGLGGTSDTIRRLGALQVMTSTLLDPGRAIPQTYVHNVTPGLITSWRDSTIDSSQMINRVNDILDPRWTESWRSVIANFNVIVSDIELYKRDDGILRCTALEKMLSINDWDACIIKDYLYSASDMSNSIKVIASSRPASYSLVTTQLRSSTYPECWWIIKNSRRIDCGLGLGIEPTKMRRQWMRFLELMTVEPEMLIVTEEERTFLLALNSTDRLSKMLTQTRSWLSLPLVGLLYPERGSYTRVYYYLRKTRQPEHIKLQRYENALKLYDKDYYRLRDILLALSLAMCRDDDAVLREMTRTENWYLDWEEKERGVWNCILCRSWRREGFRANFEDYLPFLRQMMMKEGLQFDKLEDIVRFEPLIRQRGNPPEPREVRVHFPISKIANMSSVVKILDKRR